MQWLKIRHCFCHWGFRYFGYGSIMIRLNNFWLFHQFHSLRAVKLWIVFLFVKLERCTVLMVLKRNIRDRLRDVIWTVLSINYVRFGIIYIFYISIILLLMIFMMIRHCLVSIVSILSLYWWLRIWEGSAKIFAGQSHQTPTLAQMHNVHDINGGRGMAK